MDSALKQRLLGAAVLIALAIIFVPMFFSGTPPKQDGTTTQNLKIPPAPERNFETRNLSVDPPKPGAAPAPAPAPGASSANASPPADANKVATVDTGAPANFEAPDSATKPAPATKPATATASAAPASPPPAAQAPEPPPAPATQADGRYLVNLGVYADAGHAGALVDKVKKLGYPAFAEATEYEGKSAQRVRVGPYADRAAAENVRLKIKQVDAKIPSSIVQTADADKPTDKPVASEAKTAANAKPATAKPAAAEPAAAPTLPANRAGAYVVQAGAFKAEEEANKLRDRLRNGGVAAFVEKSGDGETAFWRVRAGPYADRGGADAAVATLKQKFQVAAIVKTQP
jgi:DedD protein